MANSSPATAPQHPSPRRRRGCFSGLFTFFASFLIVVTLIFALLFGVCKGILFKEYEPAEAVKSSAVDERRLTDASYVKNILLIGQDTLLLDENSRSDTMLLVSVNTRTDTIKLVSFMRDIYIEIPGYEPSKLNASCAYGGPSLVVDTIEYNFNIKIDGYARVSFISLAQIVDAVGGVVIPEIDETEALALYDGYGVSIGPGYDILLNGEHTVQYCRIRQYQTDFSRTERQREVVTRLLQSVNPSNVSELVKAAQTVLGKIDCNLSEAQLLRLGLQALPCISNEIEQLQIPADGTWDDAMIDGQSVLDIDFDANRTALKNFLY